jgi:hypothetical protein
MAAAWQPAEKNIEIAWHLINQIVNNQWRNINNGAQHLANINEIK